jgi:hypothetical protein
MHGLGMVSDGQPDDAQTGAGNNIARPDKRKTAYAIGVLLIICLIVGTLLSIFMPAQLENSSGERNSNGVWFNEEYKYREQVKITNTDTSRNLPTGFPIAVSVAYTDLVSGGMLRSDYGDLRIVYSDGVTVTELPRGHASSATVTHVTLYFRTVEPIAPGMVSDRYYIYYGNPSAINPPVDDFSTTPPVLMTPSITIVQDGSIPEFSTAIADCVAGVAIITIIVCIRREQQ